MNEDSFILKDNYLTIYKEIFKVLNCNALWIIRVINDSLNLFVTDQSILEYYWDKKYYLYDPSFNNKIHKDKSPWTITLGTECETFNQCGFLYDVHKIFYVEEFVSIEKKVDSGHYCFRFFSNHNRFVFMNKLLNDMPIIRYIINFMIEKHNADFCNQTPISISTLKENTRRS